MLRKLKDVDPYVWVHLKEYPDRLDKAGPTAFEVSHNGEGEISTRDKAQCPIYRVSGERVTGWLNTEVED